MTSKKNDGKSAKVDRILLEKEFKVRNSPLIDRFDNNQDIRTIYNLFANILICLLVYSIISDYTKKGELHFGFRLIGIAFNRFHWVILMWLCLYGVTWIIFLMFHVWASVRLKLMPSVSKLWDKLCLIVLILHYFVYLYGMQTISNTLGFHAGSAAVYLLEATRLLMKQHSFIRTNVPKVLHHKPHSDEAVKLPEAQKFAYFTFAPTLIYRNEYPRTKSIRWRFVFYNLGEIIAIIWLLSLVIERFVEPHFEDFGLRKFKKSEVLLPVLANGFPGVLFMLGGFYAVLHACQNAFAEMLRFGDREFYKEWWISRSMSEYYRTWNVVVHDWLRIYIYKDMYQSVLPGNKGAARLTVFLVSALIHEWLMMNILGFFLPVQFLEFFIAGALFSILNVISMPVGNVIMWYGITLGMGSQMYLYTLEMFARKNCPIDNATIWDAITPKFLTCDGFV